MNEVINSQVITINIPINVLANLRQTNEEFAQSLRLAAAVKWYESGKISQENAAEIADLCREDFLLSLAQFNVSPFQYSAIEILEDAGYDTVDS